MSNTNLMLFPKAPATPNPHKALLGFFTGRNLANTIAYQTTNGQALNVRARLGLSNLKTLTNVAPTGNSGSLVNCTPTVMYRASDNTMWMITNPSNSLVNITYVQLWSVSLSALTCTFVANIDFSDVISSATAQVFSAQWFVDSDLSIHVFIAASSTGTMDTGFQVYEKHPTDTAGLTTWSSSTQISGTGLPTNMIDPMVWKEGGTYYMFYKNESTKFIEVLTSTSLLTGYTVAKSGDWAGFGGSLEAPFVFKQGSTYTILLDAYVANGMFYATSSAILGPYSAAAAITTDMKLAHGMVIPTPSSWNNGPTSLYNFYLQRVYNLGSTYQSAISTLLSSLASNSLDVILDLLHIYAVDTSANALVNLVSNRFNGHTNGSLTFTAGHGFTGDGSSGYINCDIPNTGDFNAQLTSTSFGVYILNSRSTGQAYAVCGTGIGGDSGSSDLFPWYTDNKIYAEVNANAAGHTQTLANISGMWIVSRTANNLVTVYHNGTSLFTDTTVSGSGADTLQWLVLSNYNLSASAASNFSADQIAMSFLGAGMNSTQAANFSSAVNAYMTTLGINTY